MNSKLNIKPVKETSYYIANDKKMRVVQKLTDNLIDTVKAIAEKNEKKEDKTGLMKIKFGISLKTVSQDVIELKE